jgi:hypothetical protein
MTSFLQNSRVSETKGKAMQQHKNGRFLRKLSSSAKLFFYGLKRSTNMISVVSLALLFLVSYGKSVRRMIAEITDAHRGSVAGTPPRCRLKGGFYGRTFGSTRGGDPMAKTSPCAVRRRHETYRPGHWTTVQP